ncbi:hypothetical protein [Methanosarcina sp. 2.H.A.1B.4]|uniref:hypothetical protein n=1 Tax=Methanosarcina sp. 2.H.A.1B.4 TaxID=1483600 RepID=UPI00062283B4|nr:hypothetical protein [Methanosarcina sp. 2.H.A.1B.4]KKG13063.1 hypothetical protein EO92_07805 [Methanosarcina sp. 2.H.A.1B.4]
MVDEIKFCPTCGEGTLDLEEIEESSSSECTKTFYYSCGHRQVKINISTTTLVKARLKKTVSRSGNKTTGKHQEYEIEERYRENDRDHPGKPTLERILINHKDEPTSIFHVVKYCESNEFKHMDCKSCGNSWKNDSESPIENYFSIEFIPEISYSSSFKIQCLKCNAKYEVKK